MKAAKIVVAGASVAGVASCRGLRAAGYDGDIILVDQELTTPYDRPPLSKQFLEGKVELSDITLINKAGLDDLGVEHRGGSRLTGLDLGRNEVLLADRDRIPFDGLIIATGAKARQLPNQPDLRGVHALRSLDDALKLRSELARTRRLVVVGAGFIGLEVAATAAGLGVSTTVVEGASRPLARVFGSEVAGWVTDLHESHGVEFRFSAQVREISSEDGAVSGVVLASGEHLAADVVLVAIGSFPATGWLSDSGLVVKDGVECDATLRATPRVYAAGDVARWSHPAYGSIRVEHWTSALEHGRTAAKNLVSELTGEAAPEQLRSATEIPYFWSDQYDMKIQSVGLSAGHDSIRTFHGRDGQWAVQYGSQGILTAAVGINWPGFVLRQRQAIAKGARLEDSAAPPTTKK